MRSLTLNIAIVFFTFFASLSLAGQLYKYQDAEGNWVFTDKAPDTDKQVQQVSYPEPIKPTKRIKLYYSKITPELKQNPQQEYSESKTYTLHAKNTFYCPVQVSVTSPETKEAINKVIPARSTVELFSTKVKEKITSYRWVLGDNDVQADNFYYHAPFAAPNEHRVSQGFNGRFSHTSEYGRYAVDIAMDVGTYLTAVRAGTVIWVKDDYHMSGRTRYFLDKANVIRVLHDDGTFATYAHILMDTALVKEGDKVAIGDKLARSGSSGFSTGPHLHFAITKNIGLKQISIPFKFLNEEGHAFTPTRNMIISGAVKP